MSNYHLLCMGRSSIDLYSNNIGAPFPEIESFSAYVGGSPTNVCVGAQRLGLRTALLTAVGEDPVGEFILSFLRKEGVVTRYIPEKPTARSSAVLLGIQPPDRFPLVFYRDNCADIQLDIDDVMAAPVTDAQVFLFAGTNLSQDPCRSATLMAAEKARQARCKVVLDVDFRPGQWHDVRAFGVAVRSALRLVDVMIATEDELHAALMLDKNQMLVSHSQESDTRVGGETARAIKTLLGMGPQALILKVGGEGAQVHLKTGRMVPVPGFPVKVQNILGAGDAFAAGFLYGYVHGWEWQRAARLGNACGAIVVTKHGCANFMPSLPEVKEFVAGYGVSEL
ncbi:5-dehydro-2-deoxygluconokinase [bacterium]|nr:5-dehydro-2-deoxygluconokinase [bacterium]